MIWLLACGGAEDTALAEHEHELAEHEHELAEHEHEPTEAAEHEHELLPRVTLDNRTDPPAVGVREELMQFFHETTECTAGMDFADCNSTGALKFYVNGPRITDNDWTPQGFEQAALVTHHTHASGMYLVSFGQSFVPADVGYAVIAPSGIHLEPHGAHQALRIDGTGNSGENVRIDVAKGATGISIYGSPAKGLYCDALGLLCESSDLLHLRNGTLHFEDVVIERSATDGRNGGVFVVHPDSLGVEHFYSWHSQDGLPAHCTWADRVTDDSLIRVQAYGTSPDLRVAHSYSLVDVWGPGNAPDSCREGQSIKTDAAGVYGYDFGDSVEEGAGFSVVLLGPDEEPLHPGDWGESDRPSFLFEVIEPL